MIIETVWIGYTNRKYEEKIFMMMTFLCYLTQQISWLWIFCVNTANLVFYAYYGNWKEGEKNEGSNITGNKKQTENCY